MELPLGNFFEVSINSSKLCAFMDEISKKVDTHELRLNQVFKFISSLNGNIDQKIRQSQNNAFIEIQKVRKTGQQDFNFMKLLVNDVDKKLNQKVSGLEQGLGQLSKKINQTKETLQEDQCIKLSYLEKKISILTTADELQQKAKQIFDHLSERLDSYEEKNRQNQQILDNNMRKNMEVTEGILSRLNNADNTRKIDNQFALSIATSFVDVQSRSQSRVRNNPRTGTFFKQMQQMSSNIQSKINDLQGKLDNGLKNEGKMRHSIISNSKVVKYHEPNQNPKSNFNNKKDNKFKQLQKAIMDKLARIQSATLTKISEVESSLVKHANRGEIIDQHIGILSRKLQKQKLKINEVSQAVRLNNDKKIDEKAIQNLKNMLKKASKDLQQALQLKLERQMFQKQRIRILQKIQLVSDMVFQKAQKTQVKKGLGFLQEKIKEMIIVMTEQRTGHSDGAIKKTPFKCLSCDKDLQIQKNQAVLPNNARVNKENIAQNIRCTTTQMRKRIRFINNTISTVNAQD